MIWISRSKVFIRGCGVDWVSCCLSSMAATFSKFTTHGLSSNSAHIPKHPGKFLSWVYVSSCCSSVIQWQRAWLCHKSWRERARTDIDWWVFRGHFEWDSKSRYDSFSPVTYLYTNKTHPFRATKANVPEQTVYPHRLHPIQPRIARCLVPLMQKCRHSISPWSCKKINKLDRRYYIKNYLYPVYIWCMIFVTTQYQMGYQCCLCFICLKQWRYSSNLNEKKK